MNEPLWSDKKIDGEFRSNDKVWAFVMRGEYEAELEHKRMLLREAERRIAELEARTWQPYEGKASNLWVSHQGKIVGDDDDLLIDLRPTPFAFCIRKEE